MFCNIKKQKPGKILQDNLPDNMNPKGKFTKKIFITIIPAVLLLSLILYSYNQSAGYKNISGESTREEDNIIAPTGDNRGKVKNLDKIISQNSFNNAEYVESLL